VRNGVGLKHRRLIFLPARKFILAFRFAIVIKPEATSTISV
jgi:hypothetical protein